MLSQRIEFEKLLNTRDLGGMSAADGRKIKPGKLYRSGHLFAANGADLEKLSGLIELSVDFRTDAERTEKPEPAIPGVHYLAVPILEEQRAGVSRDKESFEEIRSKMVHDAEVARRYMIQTYEGFVNNSYCVGQYAKFVRQLLTERKKGVLWHCTAGKDRAGFATVIVQELLGVPREDIRADYMMTNDFLEPEIHSLTEMFLRFPGVEPDEASKAVAYLFGAQEDYLNAVYGAVQKKYGNFDNYLTQGLNITSEEREKLRAIYLE